MVIKNEYLQNAIKKRTSRRGIDINEAKFFNFFKD